MQDFNIEFRNNHALAFTITTGKMFLLFINICFTDIGPELQLFTFTRRILHIHLLKLGMIQNHTCIYIYTITITKQMANVSLTDKASSTTPYVGPERPAVYFDIAYSCNPASLPFLPKSILLENKFLKIFTGLCIFIHQIEYTSTNLYSISTNFKENLSAKTSILAQFRHFIFINPFHTNKKLLNINFPNCTIPTYVGIHRGSGPLSKDMETTKWTVAPLIRDGFSMIGTAVGGTASAFYGFNHAMPVVQRWIKGPMWVHFLVGAPPVIVFSSACAGLAGGAIPALAQLASSAYYASMSSLPSTSSSSDNKIHKSTTL